MDIEEICEFDGWDLLWYMAHGHVDTAEFLAAIEKEYEVKYKPEDVKFGYAHNHPAGRNEPGRWIIELVKKPGRGNYPITYIDVACVE